MKVKFRVTKDGTSLYAGDHDVVDADSFGKACAEVWRKLRQQQMAKETSIGALIEHLDSGVLDQLSGARISLERP